MKGAQSFLLAMLMICVVSNERAVAQIGIDQILCSDNEEVQKCVFPPSCTMQMCETLVGGWEDDPSDICLQRRIVTFQCNSKSEPIEKAGKHLDCTAKATHEFDLPEMDSSPNVVVCYKWRKCVDSCTPLSYPSGKTIPRRVKPDAGPECQGIDPGVSVVKEASCNPGVQDDGPDGPTVEYFQCYGEKKRCDDDI